MTDRELLEMAAKAISLPECGWMGPAFMYVKDNRFTDWNPLTDDGDALRLVVKFRMMIDFITAPNSWMVGCTVAASSAGNFYEKGFTAEATRRAIVRAAAEIRKDMK